MADEVKANPRLQGTLDSVNQLAVQTYSNFTKEGSGSRDSLTSLSSQLSNVPGIESNGLGNGGGSSQSDLLSLSSPAAPAASSVTSSSGQFFSLGEDDDPISLSNSSSPLKTPTPASQGKNCNRFKHNMFLCKILSIPSYETRPRPAFGRLGLGGSWGGEGSHE